MSDLDLGMLPHHADGAAPSSNGRAVRVLPDIAQDTAAAVSGTLERVGMSGVEVAIRLPRDPLASEGSPEFLVPARADCFVSLDDAHAKGIHMSRLFLPLQEGLESQVLSPPLVATLLDRYIDSHQGLSGSSFLGLDFEYMLRRQALISEHSAWRSYPIRIEGEMRGGKCRHAVRLQIVYSSTCPCSAALSRQLMQEGFERDFAGHRWVSVAQVKSWLGSHDGLRATPHAQRSLADVSVELDGQLDHFPLVELIDALETAVSTPVQAAVKRADEQEFARLNAENLMFCEDAARRMKAALAALPFVVDFRIQASHLESLHPHDAVAITTKGVPGGYQP